MVKHAQKTLVMTSAQSLSVSCRASYVRGTSRVQWHPEDVVLEFHIFVDAEEAVEIRERTSAILGKYSRIETLLQILTVLVQVGSASRSDQRYRLQQSWRKSARLSVL